MTDKAGNSLDVCGKRTMSELDSVTVTIFGKSYTLKGGDDSDYVQEVAAFVNERMNEVADSSAVTSTAKVAILAAVNIADELFREQQRRLQSLATLEDRSVQIAHLLDKEVGAGPSVESKGDSLPGA